MDGWRRQLELQSEPGDQPDIAWQDVIADVLHAARDAGEDAERVYELGMLRFSSERDDDAP